MSKKLVIYFILIAFLFGGAFFNIDSTFVFAQEEDLNPEELKELIDKRSQELSDLQERREELREKLDNVNEEQDTLSSEISRINYQINQLNVAIESSKLAIEKLGLELTSLQDRIFQTKKSIKNTKQTISDLIVRLQQYSNENFLTILLKHDSLADGVFEMENLARISRSLTENANRLASLQVSLSEEMEEVKKKRRERELERMSYINRQGIVSEQKQTKQSLLEETKDEEKDYLNRISKIDEQQKEISRVITGIEERLRESFDSDLLPVERPDVVGFPVDEVLLTQCYGKTDFAKNAYRSSSHTGVDFRADVIGTPVFAADDGEIVAVDNNDQSRWHKYQYGKYVMIEHDNGLSSLYSHLSNWEVSEGDKVSRGEIIGYSGNTGYSTAPHLHFGLYWSPSLQYEKIPPVAGLVPVGVTVDPAPYLPNGSNVGNCR